MPDEITYEDRWNMLKQWLVNYKIEKSNDGRYHRDVSGRYCIAISVDDIFDKMTEMEQ